MIKRLSDLALVLASLPVLLPIAIIVGVAVKLTSPGPMLYWSDRIGRNGAIFSMAKFRSMKDGTPAIPTHMVPDPASLLTPIGGFLRRTSLDEIPQLWNIITGDMSIVGPRPALFNQDDLVALRRDAGILALTPGLTGWAQINGRDELPIPDKVALDAEYARRQTWLFDMTIIARTALRLLGDRSVSH